MADALYPVYETELNKEELLNKLQEWEPWGHRIDFSNGISTKNLKRRVPFSENTIQKFKIVEKVIPFDNFRGGKLLDIGCNSGYNSVYAYQKFGLETTGIDVNPRHIEVSNFLKEITDVKSNFYLHDAETFSKENYFEVILHFGTLYHLPNPLLSLKNSYNNLKKGGYLAIETQVYDDPRDSNLVYFMHMHNNDPTNFWALSTGVLQKYLEYIGFNDFQELLRTRPAIMEKGMSRVIVVAKK